MPEREVDGEVLEIMAKMEEGRHVLPVEELTRLCIAELGHAKKSSDDYLLGHAYYHLERCRFMEGNIGALLSIHVKGVEYLKRSEQWEKLASLECRFGLVASLQDNTSLALDSYIDAAAIAGEHGLEKAAATAHLNIGELYKNYGDYGAAKHSLVTALKHAKAATGKESLANLKRRIYASLSYCESKLGNLDEASDFLEMANELSKDAEGVRGDSSLDVIFASLAYCAAKGEGDVNRLIFEIRNRLQAGANLYYASEYLRDLCVYLRDAGRYGDLLYVIETVERVAPKEILPALMLLLAMVRVDYYKSVGDSEMYRTSLVSYYEIRRKRVEIMSMFATSVIDYRFRLNAIVTENENMEDSIDVFRTKSETDPLTGLYNYSKLRVVLERQVEECRKQGHSLGLSIIDVDYFKQFNDKYGHQSGDDALKAVADCMKAYSSDRVIGGRYGGDEFIMIFINMKDSEVLAICEGIKNRLREKAVPHYYTSSGYLSISQGVRNSVPTNLNKSWDYLYAADTALYDVKDYAKGSIQMVASYQPPMQRGK